MSSFVLYLIGFIILAAGLLTGAHYLGVQDRWLWVSGLVLVGFGIMVGVAKTRRRDTPPSSEPPIDTTVVR
jgi:uncharacterized membrane protein HdeD (DUF308 family)